MMIPYAKQTIDQEDIDAVVDVLKSDFLTTGPKVNEFEKTFAEYVGAKFAVAVSSGTAALHIACLAAGLKPGDELITSPMTFAASSNCALYCGATPVFADIDDKGLIDPKKVKKAITEKTKIIIPVHYGGMPCDMEMIKEDIEDHKITIIEDASHAVGAKYKGTSIGDCAFSKMTIFSFHPVKHLTTAEGGMITTNSKQYYEKLMLLRTHGITKDPTHFHNENDGPWYYEMQELGYNYRISDVQCAMGISQLRKIDGFISKRRKIAKRYHDELGKINGVSTIDEPEGSLNTYHLFPILVKDKKTRHMLFDYLKEKGILCQVHYIPVTWMPYYQKLGFQKGNFPNAENFYEREISIPMYPLLKEEEQKNVIDTIRRFFNG
jgi:perosamine synthetase